MTFTPRLVALDIDGTCVDFDGNPASGLDEAVARVVAAGVPVVIATGRGWHATRPIVEALRLPPGEHVCSNGAVRVSFPPLQILHTVTFDASAVIRRVTEVYPRAALAVEVIGTGYRVTRPFPVGELHGEIELVSVEELAESPVTRVVVRDPDAEEAEFNALVSSLGLHGVGYFVGWSSWLDIAPAGVDKAHGLADVCSELGVDAASVLAIGDGRNDVEMLRWAGRGVALGDAPAEVRRAADATTDSFARGGTANELNRWFG